MGLTNQKALGYSNLRKVVRFLYHIPFLLNSSTQLFHFVHTSPSISFPPTRHLTIVHQCNNNNNNMQYAQITKICKRISSNLQLIPPSENPTQIHSYTSLLMTPQRALHLRLPPSKTYRRLVGPDLTSNGLLLSRLRRPIRFTYRMFFYASKPKLLPPLLSSWHHAFSGHSFGDSPAAPLSPLPNPVSPPHSLFLAARASVASLRRRSFSEAACSNSDVSEAFTSAVTARATMNLPLLRRFPDWCLLFPTYCSLSFEKPSRSFP